MGLIPWRNKRDVAVRREESETWPAVQFRSEMDRLFDQFFGNLWGGADAESRNWFSQWAPALDVSEDEKRVTVSMEAPGINPDEVDISLNGNLLTVKGEKREEKADKGKDYFHTERRFGAFRRTVELPPSVDTESLSADYKNGVLTITAAKAGGATRKKIPVYSK